MAAIVASEQPQKEVTTENDDNSTDVDTLPENNSDGSRLRTLIGILRKFIGVTDLASVRFSLPAQLLEPRPNLEYWTYLDAPNAFVAIGVSDNPLDRMLEAVRFWLTKDIKYAKGRPCKPYNSCLGEYFRCNWETEDNAPKINTEYLSTRANAASQNSSSLGSDGDEPAISLSVPPMATPTDEPLDTAPSLELTAPSPELLRISYLTEQVSHHPPVSAFYASCPARDLTARGYDQITAKFTGTAIKVLPGEYNQGIFITLGRHNGETYQLTHPTAYLGGLLRGSLSVSVGDMAYISCPQTRIKAILHYVEEGWLGRTTNKIDGVIFRYDPEADDNVRVRDVPEDDILARISGPWREKVVLTLGPRPVVSHPPELRYTMIDLAPLSVAPKVLPPAADQLPNESLAMWRRMTEALHTRQYSRATALKHEIEEHQRELARERERTAQPFQPVYFKEATDQDGRPELTAWGMEVLRRIEHGNWSMDDAPTP